MIAGDSVLGRDGLSWAEADGAFDTLPEALGNHVEFHVGQVVVAEFEDLRCGIRALAVTFADIVVHPDLHRRPPGLVPRRAGAWSPIIARGPA